MKSEEIRYNTSIYTVILRKLLCCIAAAVATTTLSAQDNVTDTMDMFHIEEIVVSANKINAEAAPVQTLQGQKLKALSVHSVADAVRYFSGVQIKDYGGIGGLKTINVRSMGSHHVGVFYDGIELGNAQNGVVDLGRFSLDNMEAVSMYNGQKSAIFQSAKDYASASAIYMTTRKPEFEDDKNYNLNVGLKGGSFDTYNPSILWEHKLFKGVRSSVSAEYLTTSGEYKFTYAKENGYDTTQVRHNGDMRYVRAEAALFGDLNKGEWQAKAYIYNSERGYPGAVVRDIPGKFKNEDRQSDNNFFAQASLRKMLAPWYSFKINAKYANDYLHYISDPRLDASTMHVDNTYRQQELYASWVNMFSLVQWANIAVASDLQYNMLDSDMRDFAFPRRLSSLTSAALAVDYRWFKLSASLLYTHVHNKARSEMAQQVNEAEDLNEFTPSVIASFTPLENRDFILRAFYKRVFRMPTLNDMYYTHTSESSVNLLPEYTTQYNIGISHKIHFRGSRLRRLDLQVDAYYNEVEDKIIAMPTSNQFRWTMINLGYVEIRGVDAVAEAQWRFGEFGLSTRLNYSYQKAQDFTDPISEYYGGQVPYAPWHSGTLILGGNFKDWYLNYSFIYTGERYEAVANIPENYAQPWYTHDISLSRGFVVGGCRLKATAEVNNLLNQQYEVVQSYPMPGINYKLKLNIIL